MANYSWERQIGRELYTPSTSTAWNLRWWILLATVASMGLHSGIYVLIKDIEIRTGGGAVEQTALADDRRFEDRIALDPKLLEQTLVQTPEPEPVSENTPQDFTKELPPIDQLAPYLNGDLTATPQITAPQNIQMKTRAMGEMGSVADAVSALDTAIAGAAATKISQQLADKDALKTLRAEDDQVSIKIQDKPPELKNPTGDLSTARKIGDGGLKGMGYSSLDDLLDITTPQTGDLKAMMPSDFLFDYNSAEVKESAKLDLQKLGLLISTWTKSRVIVEGHTDTIGTEEYNRDLSLRRAGSIREYIARSLQVDVARIEVRGIGESEPLVNPTGDEQQQALNRRVVIRFVNP
jgi:OmpA-OmpF porin, OOP family